MGRSVVLCGAARCPRCSLPPRWCTCDLLPPVETKYFPAATYADDSLVTDGMLWILHPHGQPLPSSTDAADAPSNGCRRVLLLDGTWRQAGEMLRTVEGTGQCVRLPDAGDEPSRYWLRDQAESARLSTAEALMGVFRAVGEPAAEHGLRLHFELHVYATLLARGKREMAERYLGHSPLLDTAHDAITHVHRPKARR